MCVEVELLIKVLEALLPVRRPSNISTFIQQFDAVEIQHQGIGHKESPLRFPSALEFLLGFKHGISQDPPRCCLRGGFGGCVRMLTAPSVCESYFDLVLSQFMCVEVEPLFS